jgi:hypothetical protein
MFSQTMEKLAGDEAAVELLNSTKTTFGDAQLLFESAATALTTEGRVEWELENAKRERLLGEFASSARSPVVELLEESVGDSFAAALFLQDVCRELELLFDNVQNLAAIAETLPTGIRAGSLQPLWERIIDGVRKRFAQLQAGLVAGDEDSAARAAREPDPIPERCYSIIGDLVGNLEKSLSPGGAVVLALSARFLERIAAHQRRLLELISA